MSKRIEPELRIVSLYETLSDDGKRIVLALLKSKGPQSKPSSRKSASSSSTSDLSAKIKQVREATGQSRGACRQALDGSGGDVGRAISYLGGNNSYKGEGDRDPMMTAGEQ